MAIRLIILRGALDSRLLRRPNRQGPQLPSLNESAIMRIANLNPDSDIGASAWFVETEGHRLLMDTGTHPKLDGRAALPLYDLIKDEGLDAIAITHCHHDHVGSLPVAMRHFPKANVLMTELSYFIVERVLHNSVNVMQRQRDELDNDYRELKLAQAALAEHSRVDVIAKHKLDMESVWAESERVLKHD